MGCSECPAVRPSRDFCESNTMERIGTNRVVHHRLHDAIFDSYIVIVTGQVVQGS